MLKVAYANRATPSSAVTGSRTDVSCESDSIFSTGVENSESSTKAKPYDWILVLADRSEVWRRRCSLLVLIRYWSAV